MYSKETTEDVAAKIRERLRVVTVQGEVQELLADARLHGLDYEAIMAERKMQKLGFRMPHSPASSTSTTHSEIKNGPPGLCEESTAPRTESNTSHENMDNSARQSTSTMRESNYGLRWEEPVPQNERCVTNDERQVRMTNNQIPYEYMQFLTRDRILACQRNSYSTTSTLSIEAIRKARAMLEESRKEAPANNPGTCTPSSPSNSRRTSENDEKNNSRCGRSTIPAIVPSQLEQLDNLKRISRGQRSLQEISDII